MMSTARCSISTLASCAQARGRIANSGAAAIISSAIRHRRSIALVIVPSPCSLELMRSLLPVASVELDGADLRARQVEILQHAHVDGVKLGRCTRAREDMD